MELIDYIDYDEGRDFPPASTEAHECDGCGKEAASLTYQPDWDIFACPACIADCEAQLLEEEWMRESCTCKQIDFDRWNNRGCVVHDRRAA